MPGVPMVATSPMRHDLANTAVSPSGQPHPVDVHSYEPPWKALCDFALHSDLDRPGYNHLVTEVSHSFFRLPAPCRRGSVGCLLTALIASAAFCLLYDAD